jgi:hypothetical protein
VIDPELEFDKNNLQDQDLINYVDYLDIIYKEKTKSEEPDEDARNAWNKEVT